MKTISINPRWRVQLEGDLDDIDDLKRLLNGSAKDEFSFIVVDLDEIRTLTTTLWDCINTPAEVQLAAQAALKLFCGAVHIYDGCREISVGTIYEAQPDGSLSMSRSTTFEILVKDAEEDRIDPKTFAETIESSKQNGWLFSALIELKSLADWYAIYRTIEAIEIACGGRESDMRNSEIVDGKKLKLIKQMANSVRHLPSGSHRPPVPAIMLNDANLAVKAAVVALIKAGV